MSNIERIEHGDRGLGVYGGPVLDTYFKKTDGVEGTTITVADSSAAMYDAAWLRLAGTAHVGEDVEIVEYSPAVHFMGKRIPATRIVKADISAHLDVKTAKQVIERLQAWVDTVEGR